MIQEHVYAHAWPHVGQHVSRGLKRVVEFEYKIDYHHESAAFLNYSYQFLVYVLSWLTVSKLLLCLFLTLKKF